MCTPIQIRSEIWSSFETAYLFNLFYMPQAKYQAPKEAGAVVPTSYEAFETAIKETFEKLVEEGKISLVSEVKPPQIPEDLKSILYSS
ncbi:unnamed protein product [Musa acuminata subsp. burmannicoides]